LPRTFAPKQQSRRYCGCECRRHSSCLSFAKEPAKAP
jgi:hypothetical protein